MGLGKRGFDKSPAIHFCRKAVDAVEGRYDHKKYISDTTVFADVFNFYIYGGDQVIRPEQLEERDPTEIVLPYGADGAAVPVQKFRDAQKLPFL